ncbi:uncharacterized protein LOC127723496 [Mytilus californianus]|uniref:uncharacterized protein LOC127723496 n=1 Tax=Mytilus californianus TaxID=6549 RepID=UPI002246EA65|nr:uncharacterized protein LOC127723496 [Mytilus californianus]
MAQVLAVPGDVRHGFSYVSQFNHNFGRITGIAATLKGNILLCDYDKKNLILVDPLGNYLKKLNVDSEPYDIAITSQNIGYITQPNSRSVLQIDPDRMVELFHATCNELSTTVFCVSAVPNTGRDYSGKVPCFFGVNIHGLMYAVSVNYEKINLTDISKNGSIIGTRVVKFHTVNKDACLFCTGGQNYITYINSWDGSNKIYNIATIDTPTDICSDDNGLIYVSGQGSNNIHRLVWESKKTKIGDTRIRTWYKQEQDYKVLDIPLDSHHGIKEPVALCFNKDYSKLYIVNEWGKSVLVFDVI